MTILIAGTGLAALALFLVSTSGSTAPKSLLRRGLKMIFSTLLLLIAAFSLTACALHMSNSGQQEASVKPENAYRIATYNVHYIWLDREEGSWSVGDWDRRKAPLDAAVKAIEADVIGFQEMESFSFSLDRSSNLTLDYLLAQNPDFAAAAVGDPKEFPSTQPIFYRPDRLTLLDQGWFFFSDTPDVIYSRTFNGSFPAFASWAKFRTKFGKEFHVYNVHFEYSSASNRRLSSQLVVERMNPIIEAGETVFLIGDINGRFNSEAVGILETVGLDFSPIEGSTYHFNNGINLFGAIDHIAATSGARLTGSPVVLRSKFLNEWPTDHYPVFADFEFGTQ